jgi:DNA-binding transcriptional MocR family regulator
MNRPLTLPANDAALAPSAGQSLAEQLATLYAGRIRARLVAPGARLPSVRECARRHGVSPHTVVAAYDQLQAQGLVEARRQRGFFARGLAFGEPGAADAARHPGSARPGARAAPVDATALIRSMFNDPTRAGRSLGAPGLGTLPAAWLDAPLLNGALRRVLGGDGDALALDYGDPAGDERLRQALARRVADVGVACEPDQIVTAAGATHALDIIARTVLGPGDAVLVDEPGWAIEFARLTRAGMRLVPVPRGPEGPDLAAMATLAREHRPKVYVTVSVLHNPTGVSLGPAAAHQVLKLAEAHDFLVVEDDTYAALAPPHAPRLAALDGLQRTLYVSGFSKILAPGWRIGFLAAAPALVQRCIDTKLLQSLTTPAVLERALAQLLEQGQLRRHAERVTARLEAARARSVRLALEAGCRFDTEPAGLFGWVDTGVDTERLALALLDEGWLTAPGALFLATRRASTRMRINFATSQEAGFWQAFRRQRDALAR